MPATITTRSGKGTPIKNDEMDANFVNLDTYSDEIESNRNSNYYNKTEVDQEFNSSWGTLPPPFPDSSERRALTVLKIVDNQGSYEFKEPYADHTGIKIDIGASSVTQQFPGGYSMPWTRMLIYNTDTHKDTTASYKFDSDTPSWELRDHSVAEQYNGIVLPLDGLYFFSITVSPGCSNAGAHGSASGGGKFIVYDGNTSTVRFNDVSLANWSGRGGGDGQIRIKDINVNFASFRGCKAGDVAEMWGRAVSKSSDGFAKLNHYVAQIAFVEHEKFV